MPLWRVVKTHRGTVKAEGKYHKPGDFIGYSKELEKSGLIEPIPNKKPRKKRVKKGD